MNMDLRQKYQHLNDWPRTKKFYIWTIAAQALVSVVGVIAGVLVVADISLVPIRGLMGDATTELSSNTNLSILGLMGIILVVTVLTLTLRSARLWMSVVQTIFALLMMFSLDSSTANLQYAIITLIALMSLVVLPLQFGVPQRVFQMTQQRPSMENHSITDTLDSHP